MTAYALWALAEAARAGPALPTARVWPTRPRRPRGLYVEVSACGSHAQAWMVYALARASSGGVAVNIESGPFDLRRAIEEMWAARGSLTPYGQALLC